MTDTPYDQERLAHHLKQVIRAIREYVRETETGIIVLEMWRAGITFEEIGAALDISQHEAYRMARDALMTWYVMACCFSEYRLRVDHGKEMAGERVEDRDMDEEDVICWMRKYLIDTDINSMALDMRRAGYTFEEIGATLGTSAREASIMHTYAQTMRSVIASCFSACLPSLERLARAKQVEVESAFDDDGAAEEQGENERDDDPNG